MFYNRNEVEYIHTQQRPTIISADELIKESLSDLLLAKECAVGP